MQICTRPRWRNAMFQKRRFRIEGSDSLNLPVLSLLCAWARHLKTRTQRSQPICTSMLPASKTPVNQKKSIILTPCTSTQWKRTNTRKWTKRETPNSYIKLLNYRHQIVRFLQKTRAWSRLHTTLAQIIPPSEYTLYWKFFHRSRFLSNLRLPWKTRVALKIFTVLNIDFTLRIFNNLRLPWKQSFLCNFSLYWIYFLHSEFWATRACPEKQSVPWIHSPEYIFFIIQDVWATCACPEKRVALEFFTVLNTYFLSFRIFEQLALALKFFKPGEAAALPDPPPRTPMRVLMPWPNTFRFKITNK